MDEGENLIICTSCNSVSSLWPSISYGLFQLKFRCESVLHRLSINGLPPLEPLHWLQKMVYILQISNLWASSNIPQQALPLKQTSPKLMNPCLSASASAASFPPIRTWTAQLLVMAAAQVMATQSANAPCNKCTELRIFCSVTTEAAACTEKKLMCFLYNRLVDLLGSRLRIVLINNFTPPTF